MRFGDKLARASSRNESLLCVGLDPYGVPVEHVVAFNSAIVDATSDLVCAYKPNTAIYDNMGSEGFDILKETFETIPADIPRIGDAKRADVYNCGIALDHLFFDLYGCDAVTANAFMGLDAVEQFLTRQGKGVFLLCRTSNPHAHETQEGLYVGGDGIQRPYYMEIARLAHDEWDIHGTVGFVVGATAPDALKALRRAYPRTPLLVPGVGTQGGSLETAVKYGVDPSGGGLIVSISRSIIYAYTDDRGKLDEDSRRGFERTASAARQAATEFRARINRARELSPVLS